MPISEATPPRAGRVAITVGVLAALLAPMAVDRDSFPLSTYPMYSRARSGESTIVTAQGVDAAGTTIRLTPTLIGNSDDPLVVVGELRAALANDRGDERCRSIARRVAAREDLGEVERVEIVRERHDTVARTLDEPSLLDRDVRAACEVER